MSTAAKSIQNEQLDLQRRSSTSRYFEEELRQREFLRKEGTDQRYGARHLKRAIEQYVVYPIARLLATAQVHQADVLLIDRHRGEEGLVVLRDFEKRSSRGKSNFPRADAGHLMPAEARV